MWTDIWLHDPSLPQWVFAVLWELYTHTHTHTHTHGHIPLCVGVRVDGMTGCCSDRHTQLQSWHKRDSQEFVPFHVQPSWGESMERKRVTVPFPVLANRKAAVSFHSQRSSFVLSPSHSETVKDGLQIHLNEWVLVVLTEWVDVRSSTWCLKQSAEPLLPPVWRAAALGNNSDPGLLICECWLVLSVISKLTHAAVAPHSLCYRQACNELHRM